FLAIALVATIVVLGFVFAGSPTTLANGVTIAGVDVGGLEAKQAQALLESRSRAVADRPVVFTAAGPPYTPRASALGVQPERQGDGFGPLRGFRRLDVQVFGADITPPVVVLRGALAYELGVIAKEVDRVPRNAALVRRGLRIDPVAARSGLVLDRPDAARAI